MSLARCVRPGRIYFYCIRRDGYRLVYWRALVIRRSILRVFLCPPIRLAGLACFPVPCHFYLSGVEVRAEFLAEMPLCRGHEVANQPRHTLEM